MEEDSAMAERGAVKPGEHGLYSEKGYAYDPGVDGREGEGGT
jgi:hypothetical protein